MNSTLEQLERELAELTERVRVERERAKVDMLATIADMLKKGTLKAEDLRALIPKAEAAKHPIRYRDPASGATWTGRGNTPAWIKGKDKAQFRIEGATV